jgi:hypothetical protein
MGQHSAGCVVCKIKCTKSASKKTPDDCDAQHYVASRNLHIYYYALNSHVKLVCVEECIMIRRAAFCSIMQQNAG